MNIESNLFIGGPLDGKRMDTEPPYREYLIPVVPPYSPDMNATDSIQIKYVVYKRMSFRAASLTVSVWYEVTMKPEDVLSRLFARYRGDEELAELELERTEGKAHRAWVRGV